VFEREIDIESANPDFELLKKLNSRGVIITAKSIRYDFVARFFAPKYGIPEDPVTGSAYTQLVPYWASKIGSNKFRVKQMSSRGGELRCEIAGDRVFISGKAVKFMEGKINIETYCKHCWVNVVTDNHFPSIRKFSRNIIRNPSERKSVYQKKKILQNSLVKKKSRIIINRHRV